MMWTVVVLLCIFIAKRTNGESTDNEHPILIASGDEVSCSVYLAKSSIPNAGWGVFAGQDFSAGEQIGTPSVGIPFLDLPIEIGNSTNVYGALTEFLWESADIGAFGEGRRVDLFLPGPASLVNHHAALENVLAGGLKQDGNFYRHSSLMAGSMTAYADFHLIAKWDIKAGEELFMDRTENARFAHPLYYSRIPSVEDYGIVDEMIKGIAKDGFDSSLTEAQFNDLLYRLGKEVLETGYASRAQVLRDIFPRSKQQFERCLLLGTARCGLIKRHLEWIKRKGHCMDTIVTKPSTVPEAGQGAFATRKMPVGSVISVTPMITVSNAALAMDVPYTRQENTPQIQEDPELSKDMYIPQMRKNSTQQLLKNYCFGHTKSDLLLCPTTQAALINHADVSARPQQEPNVRIRWHMDTENDKEHFILQPLASITNINHTDLSSYRTRIVIEYVATRDIEFGDELLMDYTSEWQLALYSHLEHGHSTPRDVDPNHIPAKLRNDMGQPIELSEDVRPKHLAFLCDVHPNIHIVDGTTPSWEDFDSNSAVHKESWSEHFRLWFGHNEAASLYPCNVIGTDRFQNMYEIVMLVKPLVNAQVGRMFRNVPGHRIRYADSLYQSDMHLEWAFRYHIPIADANFPLQWRRDYKSAENWNLGKHMNGKQANASEESYEETLRQAKCGLYLARSNIPNAGFGLYTAVDIPGAGILVSTFASAIPAFAPQQGHHQGQHWPGKDYTWSSIGFDAASHEAWPKFVVSMLVGLVGALVNGHAGIINLEHDIGDWEPAIDGTKHHGAGGFSDYINSGFRSRYAIAAGEELFASYGEHWFHGRSQFAKMPLFHNYRDANRILASVWAFLSTESIIDSDDFVSKLLTLIPQYFVQKDNIRTKSALNIIQTMDALRRVVARNGTAEATISPRSKEWLDATGYCQDHIYVKTSTIPDAGKGAFTRRFIPKDSLLLASPTIATRRELLHFDLSGFGRSTNEFQLMTNYHFGHTSSSALFFPLTQATAINHNSARLTNGKEPNARIQFSTSDKRSMYFQSLSLEDILEQKYSTMIIDFIATRDISPDEEVFIDYGEEWEKAWLTHVDQWQSPCNDPADDCFNSSKQVKDMNKDKFNKSFHQWTSTHISICHYDKAMIKTNGEIFIITEEMPRNFHELVVDSRRKLFREGIDFDHEGFNLPTYRLRDANYVGVPCKILESYDETQTFDVVYFGAFEKDDSTSSKTVTILSNIPANYVRFQVRPFESDMMVPRSFRHEIGFPDEQFPLLWKDISK